MRTYPYFDATTNDLALEPMLKASATSRPATCSCCMAVAITRQASTRRTEWSRIAQVVGQRPLLTLVDFAYQGLAEGIRQDAAGLDELVAAGQELLVASSFSKNFGLYNERVGALSAVCKTAAAAQAVGSQLKTCIRANYSNPPAHGAAIVATILSDSALHRLWEEEVGQNPRANQRYAQDSSSKGSPNTGSSGIFPLSRGSGECFHSRGCRRNRSAVCGTSMRSISSAPDESTWPA